MAEHIKKARLQVAAEIVDLVEQEILPGLDIPAEKFWELLADTVAAFAPRNRALLERRAALQAKIDAWHLAAKGKPHDAVAYKAFLQEISYLVPEGAAFKVA